MNPSQTDERSHRLSLGRAARYPQYVSIFADAFYSEYIERRRQLFDSTIRYRLATFPILITALFEHSHAALHVYRQLNFKRLIPEERVARISDIRQFESFTDAVIPNFTEIVAKRVPDLVSAKSYWPEITEPLVPAIKASTDAVFHQIIYDLSNDENIFHQNAAPLLRDVESLRIQAIDASEKALIAQTAELNDGITKAIERYRHALKELRKPSSFLEASGLERAFIFGLEIEAISRLLKLAKDEEQHLHEFSNAIEQLNALNQKLTGALRTEGWQWKFSTAKLSQTRNSLRSPTPLSVWKWALAKLLPRKVNIEAERARPIDGYADSASALVDGNRRLLRVLACSFWVAACASVAGICSTAAGIAINESSLTYIGVGLVSVGLSIMSLTLLRGEQILEPSFDEHSAKT